MGPITMATMATLAGAAKAAKAVLDLTKGVDKSDLRAELQGAILDLQERIIQLHSELGSLLDENRALKEELALSKMEFRDDGMYWDGDEGPYCPKCIPKGVRGRVSKNPANGFLVCNVCDHSPVSDPGPSQSGYTDHWE